MPCGIGFCLEFWPAQPASQSDSQFLAINRRCLCISCRFCFSDSSGSVLQLMERVTVWRHGGEPPFLGLCSPLATLPGSWAPLLAETRGHALESRVEMPALPIVLCPISCSSHPEPQAQHPPPPRGPWGANLPRPEETMLTTMDGRCLSSVPAQSPGSPPPGRHRVGQGGMALSLKMSRSHLFPAEQASIAETSKSPSWPPPCPTSSQLEG